MGKQLWVLSGCVMLSLLVSGCTDDEIDADYDADATVSDETLLDDPITDLTGKPLSPDLDGLTGEELQPPEHIETLDEELAERERADEEIDIYYPAEDEITIQGAVLGVRHIPLKGDHTGVVVRIQPGGDMVEILVGTTEFLFDREINVDIADRILVTGPTIETDASRPPLMLARTLRWGNKEVVLRDEDGWPLWRERQRD